MRRRLLVSALLLGSALSSCATGKGPEPSGHVARDGGVSPGDASAEGPAVIARDAAAEPGCPAGSLRGFTGLQRLTRFEYDRTVADLLGTSLSLAARFPADNRANVFDNNAQLNTISGLAMTAYVDAAELLAAEVVERKPPSVVSCSPGPALSGRDCAAEILGRLLPRAYRRPVSEAEREAVLAVYAANEAEGHAAALRSALAAVLVAPQFLYKGFAGAGGAPHALDRHALATRLSYLLWSSMPDEALSVAAERGDLSAPTLLQAQIVRMLADRRADALLVSFAGQWLGLRMLEVAQPDPLLYPAFTPSLKSDMLAESHAFLRHVLTGRAPLGDLLTAPYTFANARLAAHYGLAPPAGPPEDFVQVDLGGSDRRGLLGEAALLTVTSHPDRTSVVRRGKWVLDTLFCRPLPPPPSGVDVELPAPQAAANKFEELALHRTNPTCNACHNLMDPLGFALEAYDPIGRARVLDEDGRPLYTTGELTDGTRVDGIREVSRALASTGSFEPCLAANLLSYALGRELDAGEQCDLAAIAAARELSQSRFAELVLAVVQSPSFSREGASP